MNDAPPVDQDDPFGAPANAQPDLALLIADSKRQWIGVGTGYGE